MNFHGSLLQQVAGGSPAWWPMNHPRPIDGEPSPLLLDPRLPPHHPHAHPCQDRPQSWSQLLLGGLVGEEEKYGSSRKGLSWDSQEDHRLQAKEESPEDGGDCYRFCHGSTGEETEAATGGRRASWSHALPISSPRSCVSSSFSCNMLDFSTSKAERRRFGADQSPECNGVETGAAVKKARVHGSSSSQFSTFKVRKEKLGDRITALHQMVSPFGKTDTASVLLEAIGYIRFLQSQIEALSSPYFNSASGKTRQSLLSDNCMKKRGTSLEDDDDEPKKDLRSRGLCLVPVSCTLHVGSDDDADYWAPSIGGAFR